jgi:hypothetical protein
MMGIIANATVATEKGSRYMQQLCKHWSHKFPVDFDAKTGRVEMPNCLLVMTAHPERLNVSLDVAEGVDVARLKVVVAEHLDRFAFREAPLPFVWE